MRWDVRLTMQDRALGSSAKTSLTVAPTHVAQGYGSWSTCPARPTLHIAERADG